MSKKSEPEKPKSDVPGKGIECHKCGCKDLRVVWVRKSSSQRVVRRRKCRHCGTLLYTVEKNMGA